MTQEATQVRHTQPPFVRSFARSLPRSLAVGALTAHHWGGRGRGRATLHHRSPDCSPIQVSRLTTGDGGSPLGNKATQVYYRGSLLGRGHRRRKRRHRRLHKCTILNHHSFVRSLILSLASALSRLTTGEGRVHTGRHTQPPFVARSLARQIHCHTVRPFARSFANSRLALATGEREITHGRHRSLVCSPTHGSTLGNEATQMHSQGSPLGKEGSQAEQEATQEAAQVHHTQPPFVRSLARSLARQCALTTHHWGGKGHRRHRRRHKCAILNHHSFARSLIRSLARQFMAHGSPLGREGFAGAPHSTIARPLARQLRSHGSSLGTEGRHWGTRRHKCTIGAHYWGGVTGGARGDTGGYTSAPYSTTIRSLARSPVRSHGSPLGREGSQARHAARWFARSLTRQFMSHGPQLR